VAKRNDGRGGRGSQGSNRTGGRKKTKGMNAVEGREEGVRRGES